MPYNPPYLRLMASDYQDQGPFRLHSGRVTKGQLDGAVTKLAAGVCKTSP